MYNTNDFEWENICRNMKLKGMQCRWNPRRNLCSNLDNVGDFSFLQGRRIAASLLRFDSGYFQRTRSTKLIDLQIS